MTTVQRLRILAFWATASLALLSVVYAPKEYLVWSNQANSWKRSPFPSTVKTGHREFIWVIESESDLYPYYSMPWKMVPDWERIGGELLLTFAIGGGLVFCLRR